MAGAPGQSLDISPPAMTDSTMFPCKQTEYDTTLATGHKARESTSHYASMVRPSDDRQRSPAPLAAIDPQQNDMHQLNNANIFTHTYSCTPDRGSVRSRSHSAGAVHTAPPSLSTPSFGLAALGCPSLKTRGRGPSLRPGRTSSPHPCPQQRSRSGPRRRP